MPPFNFRSIPTISPIHVAIAVQKGYMRGTNIGFEPLKALTRAEACALLSRIMKSEGKKEKITF